ncbi:MAG TPA: anhydro-N-acetylmuramic acid kinase [Symbiobacteriaceae bacterium]|nr:anhydro-N-acetylmuramic acid kinase [Symbiobacteriaceae bacterium]
MRSLAQIAAKEERLVIGLMSGTSVDGIDAALVRFRGGGPGVQIQLLHADTYRFTPEMRAEVFKLFRPETSNVVTVCQMNFALGEVFAQAALDLMKDAGVTPDQVDLIGSHGQTVWHEPVPVEVGGIKTAATLQIGEPAVIAARTGVPTIADFRVRDVAAGGQGAPLIPYMDYCLLRHATQSRALQNIGGIGNVTYVPAGCELTEVRAFDTGPGNMLIDALCQEFFNQPFDRDGAIAARGKVIPELLAELMAHPYLSAPPPKTTGRELFGLQFAKGLHGRGEPADLIATVTAFTAQSIADSYRRFLGPVDQVVVGGGGSRNPVMMRMLQEALPESRVMDHEAIGINSDAKEAIGFALLANDALLGLATNVSGATGGTPAVLGKVSL